MSKLEPREQILLDYTEFKKDRLKLLDEVNKHSAPFSDAFEAFIRRKNEWDDKLSEFMEFMDSKDNEDFDDDFLSATKITSGELKFGSTATKAFPDFYTLVTKVNDYFSLDGK